MDVVVVGGGVIGYSVAHALAERGATVQIVDMRGPGNGATQASAGMLAPYIEGHEDTLRRLGVHSLSMYDEFVGRVSDGASLAIEYARSGTLQIARSRRRLDELTRDAARLDAEDVACSVLDAEGVRQVEPAVAGEITGGLLVPAHGYVHVGQLMSALVAAAARRGVTALIDRVVGIERSNGGLDVITSQRRLEASVVVVAAGCWSGQLAVAQSPQIPVRPIKGQLLEVGFDDTPLSHVVWTDECYLVPWRSGSVLVGATVEDVGFDEASSPDAVESLRAGGAAVLPAIATADVRAVRVGLRPATRDELPLIGWSSTMPGVCLATGHYRNGILLAPLTASLVADLVAGTDRRHPQWIRDAVAPSRMTL